MKKILFALWSIAVAVLFFFIGRRDPDHPIKKEDIKTETNPTEKGKKLASRARDLLSRLRAGGLVLILVSGFAVYPRAFEVTDDHKKTMIAALELYAAMHSGSYTIVPVATSISNKMHVIKFEIRAAKQVFTFTQKIPVKYIAENRNPGRWFLGAFAGSSFGVIAQGRIYKRLELFGLVGYDSISGGAGIRF